MVRELDQRNRGNAVNCALMLKQVLTLRFDDSQAWQRCLSRGSKDGIGASSTSLYFKVSSNHAYGLSGSRAS